MSRRDVEEVCELLQRGHGLPEAPLDHVLFAPDDLEERIGVTDAAPERREVLSHQDHQCPRAVRTRHAGLSLDTIRWQVLRNREQHASWRTQAVCQPLSAWLRCAYSLCAHRAIARSRASGKSYRVRLTRQSRKVHRAHGFRPVHLGVFMGPAASTPRGGSATIAAMEV